MPSSNERRRVWTRMAPRRWWRTRDTDASGKDDIDAKLAVYSNRRRIRGDRGQRLLSMRGERIERSFAHLYETGGMRRKHLRGHDNIRKRVLIHAGAINLVLLRGPSSGGARREACRASFRCFPCSLLPSVTLVKLLPNCWMPRPASAVRAPPCSFTTW
jgi:hypothetical protein